MNQNGIQLNQKNNQIKSSVEIKRKGHNKTLVFDEPTLIIGSLDSAHIKLSEYGVSPIHAVIETSIKDSINDSLAKIIDLASNSGIFVNGYKVVSKRIFSGDIIEIGDAKFTFEFKTAEMHCDFENNELLLVDEKLSTKIFEEKDEQLKTIEFVYTWNDSIIDVQHFKTETEVGIPALYSNDNTPLIASRSEHQWLLHLTEKMSGFIYRKGLISYFNEFDINKPIDLQDHEFVKVQLGAISIFIRTTKNLPFLSKKIELDQDPLLRRNLITSLMIAALTLFAISRMTPIQPLMVSKCETIDCRFYQSKEHEIVLRYEDVFGTDPKNHPKYNPFKREGAKPKNEMGKVGKKTNSIQNKNPKKVSQALTADGNVQKLKNATDQILKLIGSSNLKMTNVKKNHSQNTSTGIQNTGLSLTGSGPGGGGNAETLLGLSNKGDGPDRDGKDQKPNFDFYSKIRDLKPSDLPKGKPDGIRSDVIEEITLSSIDMEEVEKAIHAHKYEFLYCYEKEINTGNPNLKGKIFTKFYINAEGRAINVSPISNTLKNLQATDCILNVIKRISFPKPKGTTNVEVKYPFKFSNGGFDT